MNQPLARRDFLQLLALTSAAGMTAGMFGACRRHAKPEAGTTIDLFASWERVRRAVRNSPDHLPAAAERLVAAKDPAAIHAFVRDQIVTYPDSPSGFTSPYNDRVRWGARATLRGGAGTAREKSELLVALFSRAGFKAEVVSGKLKPEVADTRRLLLRKTTREFKPDSIDDLLDSLHVNRPADSATADQSPDDRPRLLAQRLAPEVSGVAPQSEGFAWGPVAEDVPLVKVEVGGRVKYANVIVPDAEFGEPYTQSVPGSAKSPYPLNAVVTLQIATTLDPKKRLTLLEGRWAAAELAGRQLIVGFTPAYDFDSLLRTPVGEINSFTPVLLLRGVDLGDEESRRLSFVGDELLTSWGDVIAEDGQTGEVLINDEAVGTGERDVAQEARVETLELTAMPDTFPTVRVRVKALDAEGRPVAGLSPQAFTLREENRPAAFTLRKNQLAKPRVLLLFDLSDSIPEEFRKESAARIGRQITEQLLASHPEAEVKAATLYDYYLSAAGDWTNDPQQIEQGIQKLIGVGSYMWAGLVEAAKLKPTVVVLFTDGAATDKPDPVSEAVLGRLAPVVLLAVGKTEQETIDRIARVSGGKAFNVTEPDEAVKLVGEYLKRVEAEPYALVYTAPPDGHEERSLTISMPNAAAQQAQTTYHVPPANQRLAPPQLSGIYLTVRVGEKEVTRTLASYLGDADAGEMQQERLDAVRAALFDTTMLSFEGAAPSPSVWIDEVLTNKLKWRSFLEAAQAGDKRRMLDEVKKGLPHLPPELVTLNLPIAGVGLSDGDSLTFENDLRVIMHTVQPRFGANVVTRRADILPVSTWSTAAADVAQACTLTIERTSKLSFLEAAAFPHSAAGALEKADLRLFKPNSAPDFGEAANKDAALTRAWRKLFDDYGGSAKFAPSQGSPVSVWAVDPSTGTALAVLSDGSGGGTNEVPVQRVFDRGETLLNLAGAINSVAAVSSLPISVWLILEKTKLKKLAYATRRIAEMDAPGGAGSVAPDTALANALCDAIKLALGELIQHVAESSTGLIQIGALSWGWVDKADAVFDVAGLGFVKCPGLSS
jgi:hypothetical protein